MKYMLLAAIFIVFTYAQNKPPIWPNQFEVSFTEDLNTGGVKSKTNGTFHYDFTNQQYRVDRVNGENDRYCGSARKLQNTPCSHLVHQGKRYLYFPDKNDCCYCCDDVHGCGILTPDWAADSVFIGLEVENGRQVEKWEKKGLQSNYIYIHADDKVFTGIDQTPNDFMHFNTDTYKVGIKDSSIFNLPSICSTQKTCSLLSVCTQLRNRSIVV